MLQVESMTNIMLNNKFVHIYN